MVKMFRQQKIVAWHSVLRLAYNNRAWFSLTIRHLYVAPTSGDVKESRVSENSAVGYFITGSLHIASVGFRNLYLLWYLIVDLYFSLPKKKKKMFDCL